MSNTNSPEKNCHNCKWYDTHPYYKCDYCSNQNETYRYWEPADKPREKKFDRLAEIAKFGVSYYKAKELYKRSGSEKEKSDDKN